MKLTDLDPHWVSEGARRQIALSFNCPCGKCGTRIGVGVRNPPDGGTPVMTTLGMDGQPTWWMITGFDWEIITAAPSIVIWRDGKEHWHGFLTQGQVFSI